MIADDDLPTPIRGAIGARFPTAGFNAIFVRGAAKCGKVNEVFAMCGGLRTERLF